MIEFSIAVSIAPPDSSDAVTTDYAVPLISASDILVSISDIMAS